MTKSRKKRATINRTVAINRIEKMIGLIEENVQIGLSLEAALESANDIVVRDMTGKLFYGADCFNTVKQCIALELVLTLARLFDFGTKRYPANKRDVASIPLLIRLLKQKRCRSAFGDRASREWFPRDDGASNVLACNQAINRAVESFSSLQRTHEGRRAISSLKQFRDKKLAHSLIDSTIKEIPRYKELFLLMRVARNVAGFTKLAIHGIHTDFGEIAKIRYDEGKAFWEPSLRAAAANGNAGL